MKLWDITQPLRPGLPVWPGDTAYREERTWQIDENCPVNVSKVTLSTHSGTHADAPLHYDPAGLPSGQVDLSFYLGPCVVLDVTGAGRVVQPTDIAPAFEQPVERLLLKTYEETPLEQWDEEFKAVAPESIDALSAAGVRLIGTDTPSLDPQTSKTMDAHHAVRRAGMAILEGLVLDNVPEGRYELIALPIKLANLDAAPVRAVLRGPIPS
ncbi:arylformamidase [Denitrobaculum tricleocarpae]|uniref:Kynurenine formamidase n=1 Tax=Denitrobaculum tricleocarpae TaxID=2591009 RepID=A0A545TU49_9PROT|nr:arylformamidase [Denitrobaculum tricleocarpae]TQV80742.1 arylformamidase [Denitrobaculum tricleocarpae]